MIKNVLFFVCISAISSCSHKNYPAKSLKSTAWYAYAGEKKYDNAAAVYEVTDSIVRLHGETPGYLMSKASYTNFELSLEFRWNTEQKYQRGKGLKNSGVMYNVPDTARDMLWPAGIQFQVKEGGTGDFILLENVTLNVRGETKAPGKSIAVARTSDQEKPVGEWNTILIKSVNGKCSQYLNGVIVNEGIDASSKRGRILLQYEGAPIDFRKVVVSSKPVK